MSLDISLTAIRPTEVFGANLTHNLAPMARSADLYIPLWHPEQLDITTAQELIPYLESGLAKLKAAPDFFKTLNPVNGWGSYDGLVGVVEQYLQACKDNPDAVIGVSR